ncbi:MAG: xanthine dehydrogenase family protein molybdopterin-binding subunit, partial [Pseudomonadota bacterium]
MNPLDPGDRPVAAFGVGRSVARKEDRRLLAGGGRYTGDITLDDQAVGYVLRSPYAHGVIRGLAVEDALSVPGVIAVYTGADLERAGYNPLPCPLPLKSRDGTPLIVPARHVLARDRVRYVGEPVAFVVAETLAAARDGAERIGLDIEALPAVTDIEAAVRADAPQLFEEAPGNVCLDWSFGDEAAIDGAFAGAAHVTRLK